MYLIRQLILLLAVLVLYSCYQIIIIIILFTRRIRSDRSFSCWPSSYYTRVIKSLLYYLHYVSDQTATFVSGPRTILMLSNYHYYIIYRMYLIRQLILLLVLVLYSCYQITIIIILFTRRIRSDRSFSCWPSSYYTRVIKSLLYYLHNVSDQTATFVSGPCIILMLSNYHYYIIYRMYLIRQLILLLVLVLYSCYQIIINILFT